MTEYRDESVDTISKCLDLIEYPDTSKIIHKIENFKMLHPVETQIIRQPVTTLDIEKIMQESRDIRFLTADEYRDQRHEQLLELKRGKDTVMYHTIMDLTVKNQIQRGLILKDEQQKYRKMKREFEEAREKYEIVPVEHLRVLEEHEFLDSSYAEALKKYDEYIQELKKQGQDFLNLFFQYLNYFEIQLANYRNETNELFSQFASTVTALQKKEDEARQIAFKRSQEEALKLERDEDTVRRELDERYKDEIDFMERQNESLHQIKELSKKTT